MIMKLQSKKEKKEIIKALLKFAQDICFDMIDDGHDGYDPMWCIRQVLLNIEDMKHHSECHPDSKTTRKKSVTPKALK